MLSNSTLFQEHAKMRAAVLLLQYQRAHFGPENLIGYSLKTFDFARFYDSAGRV
jgi:hypothetical protein